MVLSPPWFFFSFSPSVSLLSCERRFNGGLYRLVFSRLALFVVTPLLTLILHRLLHYRVLSVSSFSLVKQQVSSYLFSISIVIRCANKRCDVPDAKFSIQNWNFKFFFLVSWLRNQNDESLLCCCYKVWWASVHCLCDVQRILILKKLQFYSLYRTVYNERQGKSCLFVLFCICVTSCSIKKGWNFLFSFLFRVDLVPVMLKCLFKMYFVSKFV